MATNTQLKFYKRATVGNSGLKPGAIYFEKNTGIIHVATSATTTDKFGGNLLDAIWNPQNATLVVTKNDGSQLTLNFSDMASASVMSAAFTSIGLNDTGSYTGVYKTGNSVRADIADAKVQTDKIGDITVASSTEGDTAFAKIAKLQTQISAITGEGSGDTTTLAGLAVRMGDAEADITALNDVVSDYSGKGAIKTAISTVASEAAEDASKKAAAAKTTIVEGTENSHLSITSAVKNGAGEDGHTEYTITLTDVASDNALTELTNRVTALDSETGRVKTLETKVDSLSSATHFEGVVTPSVNGTVENDAPVANYDKGDIIIYGNKEYVLNEVDGTKSWVELGDTSATDAKLTEVESNLNTLTTTGVGNQIANKLNTLTETGDTKGDKVKVTVTPAIDSTSLNMTVVVDESGLNTALAPIATNTSNISNLKTGTGLNDQYKPGYNQTYTAATSVSNSALKDVTNLKAADEAIFAAVLKNAADIAAIDYSNIVSASGDDYVTASATNNSVTISSNVKTLADAQTAKTTGGTTYENFKGLASVKDVYEALCWEEFE